MRRAIAPALLAGLACAPGAQAAVAGTAKVAQAERMARAALAACAAGDRAGTARAREALERTASFDPTAFVKAGRKGEVVEDLYVEARKEYRSHRALVYQALGECLAAEGATRAATRYLGRAVLLDGQPERRLALARVHLAENRPQPALDLLLPLVSGVVPTSLLEQAADAAGLPSVQVEVDRVRLRAIKGVAPVEGPVRLPPAARLSTGGPLRLEGEPIVFYVGASACQTCSADLQALKRATAGQRVVLWPEDAERDQALRQVVGLYRYDWPFLVGVRPSLIAGAVAPSLVVIGREGWSAARLSTDRMAALPDVLAVLGRRDLEEVRPRRGWNGRPPDRIVAVPPPAFLEEGLAPGEDAAVPDAFTAGLAAFRKGRFEEAMRLIGDAGAEGWLLPPEARLNRAVCLARLGRKEEARLILLRIGDSRFQEQIDRAMEGLNLRQK